MSLDLYRVSIFTFLLNSQEINTVLIFCVEIELRILQYTFSRT